VPEEIYEMDLLYTFFHCSWFATWMKEGRTIMNGISRYPSVIFFTQRRKGATPDLHALTLCVVAPLRDLMEF